MPMNSFFVTSSGTDTGKTFITEILLTQLRAAGLRCEALKPVATGFDDSPATDTARLIAALGRPYTQANVDACSPWRFSQPLSPHIAARRESRHLELDEIVKFCMRPNAIDVRIIEGIGGVMVPLNAHYTVIDWISRLNIPAILVVGSYLGAISHALTAIDAIRTKGIAIAAIIVNQSVEEPMPTETTLESIRQFSSDTPLALMPRMNAGAPEAGIPESTAQIPDLVELLSPWLVSKKRQNPPE